MNKKTYFFLLILIAAAGTALRIIALDRTPPGISTDILLYFSNARTIAETGKDIYGAPFPLYFVHKEYLVNPVTVYVTALIYKLFGFSHVNGYAPNLVMSLITIIITALMGTVLTGKRGIGILAGIFVALSPWHYHLSRTGFEGVFAYSLILVGILFSLKAKEKPSYLWYTVGLFTLASFSYKAVNIFLIFYPLVYFLAGKREVKSKKNALVMIAAFWAIVILQSLLLFSGYRDNYSRGIIQKNLDFAKTEAAKEQNQSDAPRLFRLLASNVPLSLTKKLIRNYVHFFSPQYLLTRGDNDMRFSTTGHGQVYLIDLLFFIMGIIWLKNNKQKITLILLAGIILTAPMAALISDEEYAIRTFIAVFPLGVISGAGAYNIMTRNYRRIPKNYLVILLTGIYLAGFLLYLYRYHYLYIHESRKAWGGTNREVFCEAYRRRRKYPIITFGRSSEFEFLEFTYWNKLPVSEIQKQLASYNEKILTYENIRFVRTCGPNSDSFPLSQTDFQILYAPDSCKIGREPDRQYFNPKTLEWTWGNYTSGKIP
jgi:4-amino-4-deoxy-L-arabinose transferase-like glycosyltransferase